MHKLTISIYYKEIDQTDMHGAHKERENATKAGNTYIVHALITGKVKVIPK